MRGGFGQADPNYSIGSPAELDALGYRDMIRVAVKRGLITAGADGCRYRKLRNITAQVYDPAKAAQVFGKLVMFLHDAQALLSKPVATNSCRPLCIDINKRSHVHTGAYAQPLLQTLQVAMEDADMNECLVG